MLLFRLRVRRRSPWMLARLGWWWRRLLFHAAVCLAVHWNWTGGESGDGGGDGRWSKWEMWDEKGNRVRHHNKLCTHCTKTKCHTLQSYMYHETDTRSRHFQQEWHSQMLCDEVSISITLISKTVYTCLLTMQTYVYVCKYLYMRGCACTCIHRQCTAILPLSTQQGTLFLYVQCHMQSSPTSLDSARSSMYHWQLWKWIRLLDHISRCTTM